MNRRELEASTAALMRELRSKMPEGVGFALLMFDFGPDGFMVYGSNAQRADMVRALREAIERLESNTDKTAGDA